MNATEMTPPGLVQRLISCPFCGGDAESDTMQGFRRMKDGAMSNAVAIYCTKCTGQMTMCHEDFKEYAPEDMLTILTEAWNVRVLNVRMSDAPLQPSDSPSASQAHSSPSAGSGNLGLEPRVCPREAGSGGSGRSL